MLSFSSDGSRGIFYFYSKRKKKGIGKEKRKKKGSTFVWYYSLMQFF